MWSNLIDCINPLTKISWALILLCTQVAFFLECFFSEGNKANQHMNNKQHLSVQQTKFLRTRQDLPIDRAKGQRTLTTIVHPHLRSRLPTTSIWGNIALQVQFKKKTVGTRQSNSAFFATKLLVVKNPLLGSILSSLLTRPCDISFHNLYTWNFPPKFHNLMYGCELKVCPYRTITKHTSLL